MNWWAITTISIWLAGGFGAGLSKDSSCLFISLVGSVMLGIFYGLIHS